MYRPTLLRSISARNNTKGTNGEITTNFGVKVTLGVGVLEVWD